MHAEPGGGDALVHRRRRRVVAPRRPCARATTARSTCRRCCPSTPTARSCAEGDIVGQYFYCLERAGELLEQAGLSLSHLVQTIDYSTPATRERYPKIGRARTDLLGPGVPGRRGHPHERAARAGRAAARSTRSPRRTRPRPVNPGWARYDTLTYNPGLRAGNTLYMSGFASLDMETQESTHAGDLRAQAEYDLRLDPADPGGGRGRPRATCSPRVEYVTPDGLGRLPRRGRRAPRDAPRALPGLDRRRVRRPAARRVPARGRAHRGDPPAGRRLRQLTHELLTDDLRARIGETRRLHRARAAGARVDPLLRARRRRRQPAVHRPPFARARTATTTSSRRRRWIAETNQYMTGGRDATTATWATPGTSTIPDTRLVRGGNAYEFHQPADPDTVVTATWRIAGMTERAHLRRARHARGHQRGDVHRPARRRCC